VLAENVQPACAASNDDCEWALDLGCQMTKLVEMPINAFGLPTSGGELEGQCRHFLALRDEVDPVRVVAFRACIDVQCGR